MYSEIQVWASKITFYAPSGAHGVPLSVTKCHQGLSILILHLDRFRKFLVQLHFTAYGPLAL